ncbi:hypothetical protein [Sinorhizobium meliloti]|uniref:amino acid kinase family protein n=1 Tax=Rhizobium meliloti TaxID=382 RepID=UPI0003722CC7|nr:hypothetical protein [Sinorhizobium meliloti]
MQSNVKGFWPYGFSVIVKFGGSLMADLDTCRAILFELEQLRRRGHQFLVVPGGGLPDKAIEAVDSSHPLADFTAHHACALAQDQTGYMLADPAFSSGLVTCSTLGECRTALSLDKIPVLLPSRILFAVDPVEWSWEVTSDSVAAWVAWLTDTPRLAILTDVDGVYRNASINEASSLISEIDANDLAELGHTSVDACAAHFIARRGLSGVVLNGAHPSRLRDWIEGRHFLGTRIMRTAQGGTFHTN